MVGKYVIDSIEKVFRYLLPGVVFVILFQLSYPNKPFNLLGNNFEKYEIEIINSIFRFIWSSFLQIHNIAVYSLNI